MATNTTAVAKQVRAFCLESMEQKKLLSLNYPHQQNPLTHIIRRQRF